MTTVIVSGHGNFATGITSSLELILGVPQNYEAIDFVKGSNIEELERKFNDAIEKHKEDQIIILVDLLSGSPFNIAIKKSMEHENIRVFYGTNLGMLLELCAKIEFDGDVEETINTLVETGKTQVGEFDKTLFDDDDEEE